MSLHTAFHKRTSSLNQYQDWRDWGGYIAASQYESYHEREYFGIRSSAALLDISPLRKYEISGPDAGKLVNRVVTRDIGRRRVGQIFYSPWCDDDGKLMMMRSANLLEERFETDALKATLSASGIIGTFLGLCSSGTAYVLMHHYMGEIHGVFRTWGFAQGDTGGKAMGVAFGRVWP